MSKYITLITVATIASLAACSKNGDSSTKYDEPVEEAKRIVEQTIDATKQGAGTVMQDIESSGAEAIKAGKTTMDDVEGMAKTVVDDADGEVADIVNQAENMANDVMQDVDGMSEEEMKEKARQELGIGQ